MKIVIFIKTLTSKLRRTFFGHRAENETLDEIFNLVYYGGFDAQTVYQLPVPAKKYLLNRLVKAKKTEKDAIEGD